MTPNTCHKADECRGTLIDMALDDTAHCDALKLAEVIRHVDACPLCKTELIEYQHLIASLRPRVPEVPPHRIAMLESAVRAEVARIRRRPRTARWAAGIAAAACIVVAVGLICFRQEPQAIPGEGRDQILVQTPQPVSPGQMDQLRQAVRLRKSALRHHRLKDYVKAEASARKTIKMILNVLAETPDGEVAVAADYQLYRCYELLGEDHKRERSFERYIQGLTERDGKQAAAQVLLEDGRRLFRENSLSRARARLEHALALCPSGRPAVYAHVLLAIAHERAKLFDEARDHYKHALALKPSAKWAADIKKNLILLDSGRGYLDAAIAKAKALCQTPQEGLPVGDRVNQQYLLAQLYKAKGDTLSSTAVLQDIVAKYDPKYSRAARGHLKTMLDELADKEMSE